MANATVQRNGEIPLMKGSDKDHKKKIQMRPICNGMVGPKKALSGIVSEVLENVSEICDHKICKSTEEMIYSFEEYGIKLLLRRVRSFQVQYKSY